MTAALMSSALCFILVGAVLVVVYERVIWPRALDVDPALRDVVRRERAVARLRRKGTI